MIQKSIALLFIVTMFCSCGPQQETEEQLSSDIVFNPNTAQEGVEKPAIAEMTFDHLEFDFGVIFQGEEVIHKYKFTNTGGAALIISDVSASCGCTVPTYTKEPLAPGEEGYIEVKFDSAGRKGMQHKSVTVVANTQPNRIELNFVAEVEVEATDS